MTTWEHSEAAPDAPTAIVQLGELDAVRAATEDLSARLASLDGTIEERMLRAADLAARGAEIVVQEALKNIRGETDAVRNALAAAVTDLRSLFARLDAGRGSELGALRGAIEGIQDDVARVEALLDDRVSRLDAASQALDAELASLRARLDAMVASSSTGMWVALVRMLWDPIGGVAAVAGSLLGRLTPAFRA